MKKRRKIAAKVALVVVAITALVIAAVPSHACNTQLDQDCDGIYNTDELEGICLPELPNICMEPTNPDVKDLYVMIDGDMALLPDNPFEFIEKELNSNDPDAVFRIQVHLIARQNSQRISETQNAALLYLFDSESDGDLGISQVGVLASGLTGSVYPNRIVNDVYSGCNENPDYECVCETEEGVPCYNPDGSPVIGPEQIIDYYKKEVLAHEIMHMLGRVVPPDRKLENHYPQLGFIMDHHMYWKSYRKAQKTVWFIRNEWAIADKPLFTY